MKPIFSLIFVLVLFAAITRPVRAGESVVTSSATLVKSKQAQSSYDLRVDRLKSFLEKKKSPLAVHSSDFINFADKYGLDWRLVPSITGVESSFGIRIPKNSYNAYGWNNGNFRFVSWTESIEKVSKALREKYYDKGAKSVVKIAYRYAPSSATWGSKVKFFMNKIDSTPIEFDL